MLDAIRFLFLLLQSSYKAAVHGCHCRVDERMCNVLAMLGSSIPEFNVLRCLNWYKKPLNMEAFSSISYIFNEAVLS